MALVKVKLKELRHADVRFISLVDRAATRIPFRVLKRDGEETEMGIDLMNIIRKRDVAKPEVAAVVVFAQKDDAEATELVRKAIEEAGFKTDSVRKADEDTVVYAQCDAKPDEVKLIRLSDQLLVAVKNFTAPTTMFDEIQKEQGYIPGMEPAVSILNDQLLELALKDEDTSAEVKEVLGAYGEYIQALTKLPAMCFKADKGVSSVIEEVKKKKKKPIGQEGTIPGAGGTIDDHPAPIEPVHGVSKAEGSAAEEAAETALEEATEQKMKDRGMSEEEIGKAMEKFKSKRVLERAKKSDAATVQKKECPMCGGSGKVNGAVCANCGGSGSVPGLSLSVAGTGDEGYSFTPAMKEEILGAIKGVSESLGAKVTELTTKVDGVVKEQVEQKKTLDGVVKKADTLETKLGTTVVAGARDGDRPSGRVEVTKADNDPRTGFFDTAFMPRNADGSRRR